jgi:hypothetical protein
MVTQSQSTAPAFFGQQSPRRPHRPFGAYHFRPPPTFPVRNVPLLLMPRLALLNIVNPPTPLVAYGTNQELVGNGIGVERIMDAALWLIATGEAKGQGQCREEES